MPNFSFLENKKEYALFAPACMEAEKIYAAVPAMCAAACRKAMELAVKWVYSADTSVNVPYKDNLASLLHEPSFRDLMERGTWQKLLYILKLGNLAVHTERNIKHSDAILALRGLFEFILWIDYCYGGEYEERKFQESLIPSQIADTRKIKEQEENLRQKEAEIEKLQKQIQNLSAKYTAEKEEHKNTRTFHSEDISEFATRKIFIDVDLKQIGWRFDGEKANVAEEYEVQDMAAIQGQTGWCDYVLFDDDALPLAVVEAKRTSKDPKTGERQAQLYADCLERKFTRRPFIFLTNGFETYFWDSKLPPRKVSGIFGKSDLHRLMTRREQFENAPKSLLEYPINDKITDRYYQKEAIRAVCDGLEKGERKFLLVMATGTGKTRTSSSLVDVLSRANRLTNVLFLADRTALVKQAKDDFRTYLPDTTLCNLCMGKDDKNARIIFSTYPTLLNAVNNVNSKDGRELFSPAHFDLIIIDESHRSIFKKYRAIFEYFDAVLVGLTATPKTDVDRNTYDFFEMEHGLPTYAYDYETAVHTDKYLVPYYNYEVKTKFLDDGIHYDELSEKDKERFEEDFTEDGLTPEYIPSEAMNRFVFNEETVKIVLQDLMEKGIRTAGGDRLGKTVVFAQNKRHADFIVQCFNKLYPQYGGTFARRVVCDDAYVQSLIDDFKQPEKEPHIAVSVDMLDTGIDVPEIVNLVFFKKVRSKTKFWQMIGRGTRLCKGLSCSDQIDGEYIDKRRFLIFDYCANFEFFRVNKKDFEARETKSITENIFGKQIRLITALQDSAFSDDASQTWRKELVEVCRGQILSLNTELIAVKLQLRHVIKYQKEESFLCLNEESKSELATIIAPLVWSNDRDEAAKLFDNLMYGLMLDCMEHSKNLKKAQKQLKKIASVLEKKTTIPQVKEKLELIKAINSENFFAECDVLMLEKIRIELRELMRFLDNDEKQNKLVVTKLHDPVLDVQEGNPLNSAYDFEDYRAKVNRYVNEHPNTLAIYNLTHNIPLSKGDYQELERVLTCELGSKTDYAREYGNTPFGLLIRKIAKLDREAAMQAFSAFINDSSLNQNQIAFVHKIINYVIQNGYMENTEELLKAPFDKPAGFFRLFDDKTQEALVQIINQIKENAVQIAM